MITANCGDILVEQRKACHGLVSRCVLAVCPNHVTGISIIYLRVEVVGSTNVTTAFVSITKTNFASIIVS